MSLCPLPLPSLLGIDLEEMLDALQDLSLPLFLLRVRNFERVNLLSNQRRSCLLLVSFLYILLGFDSSVPALLGSSPPYGA